MNLLHLDSSILGPNSASRPLSAAVVARLAGPDVTVTARDLVADPIPPLTGADLAGDFGGDVITQFLAADTVVIGVALYNFGVSAQLKAWVDRILIAGRTFRYTAAGAEGLCAGKRVILTVARGGIYSPGSPAASFEHAETYLRAVFGFIGVTDLTVFVAEGLAISPEVRTMAVDAALAEIAAL